MKGGPRTGGPSINILEKHVKLLGPYDEDKDLIILYTPLRHLRSLYKRPFTSLRPGMVRVNSIS